MKKSKFEELKKEELVMNNGGTTVAEWVGIGIGSGLVGSYLGPLGMAWYYYNVFKD